MGVSAKKNLLIVSGIATIYLFSLILYKLKLISFLIPCLVKSATGLECFACGTNRAFLALIGGEIQISWQINPMAILATIAFLIYLFSQIKQYANEN